MNMHGLIDYIIALFLIAAPGFFNFSTYGTETWVALGVGTATILFSLLTDYQLGLVKVFPMPVHLALDVSAGIFLAVSPWLFEFSQATWILHLITGILIVAISLCTHKKPVYHFVRYQRKKLHKLLHQKYSMHG